MGTFECEYIAASRSWLDSNARFVRDIKECDEADAEQLHKVSFLETPQDVVAVFRQPEYDCNPEECVKRNLCLDLFSLIDALPKDVPVYGTFLDGKYIYETELKQNGLIVMGNEGNGISDGVASLVTDRLYIPNFPPGRNTSESLNVAIATAVVCSEFRRRQMHSH